MNNNIESVLFKFDDDPNILFDEKKYIAWYYCRSLISYNGDIFKIKRHINSPLHNTNKKSFNILHIMVNDRRTNLSDENVEAMLIIHHESYLKN